METRLLSIFAEAVCVLCEAPVGSPQSETFKVRDDAAATHTSKPYCAFTR